METTHNGSLSRNYNIIRLNQDKKFTPIRFSVCSETLISYFLYFLIKNIFSYYILEIDHCYHAVPFLFSEIDKLTFPFIYAIFSISFLLIYWFPLDWWRSKACISGKSTYKPLHFIRFVKQIFILIYKNARYYIISGVFETQTNDKSLKMYGILWYYFTDSKIQKQILQK